MHIQEHIFPKEQIVLNKPFGQDIKPDLWYLLRVDAEKLAAGLLTARNQDNQEEVVIAFGNKLTAYIFMKNAGMENAPNVIVIQGFELQEFWISTNI